ncbi:hypothetical protein [Ruminiclostridium papyrosolvens]|uniref:Spore coat protein n=1 Tax=Ruminiclostridium papyrosolvens C7 TaxID=1330534 RepID=U4R3G6_9FIRM|nr:hypothetical protein [Ruminiclostridium papyrosolvens]EPR13044.1 hypothetical protein L323_03830 [Ruminiclostridium papyrosolvens C7]
MPLTSKELMLIQDNISMCENNIKYLQGCAQLANDSQIKNLCNQLASEEKNGLQLLMKHINTAGQQ